MVDGDGDQQPTGDTTEPAWPLGPLEERILQIVWQAGTTTVRDVREVLRAERQVAYTTVMTVMSRLADKGILRVARGASFEYSAAFTREEYAALVTRRLARTLRAQFGDLALAQFAAELEHTGAAHLDRLAGLAGMEPPHDD